jgi:hypothetical protein
MKRSMLVVLAAVSLATVLTTVAIFVFGGGPSTKTVVIKKGSFIPPPNWSGSSPLFIDDYFSPANLTIKVGEKVLWYNADSVTHTVTSLSTPRGVKGPDLILNTGGSGEFVFHTQGTYVYYCTIHPWKGGFVNVIPESAGEGVIVGY